MKKHEYDKKELFETECRDLLKELVTRCHTYDIPFFFTACVKNTAEGSEYVSEMASAPGRGFCLTDDRISKHIAVIMGFDVVPSREDIEIDMMDVPEDELEIEF